MLGGRLDAEGYFAAEFTAINNPKRSRDNKYVMVVLLLKLSHKTWNLPFNSNSIIADKSSLCLTPG
ncbi:hypothetical protein F0263_19620 [Vibrio anguillarum]|nr:hypothetical protein [Vibrio anguillarum]